MKQRWNCAMPRWPMLAAALLLASAATARAQDACRCDYATIYAGDLPSFVTVCVMTPGGFDCIVVGPGSIRLVRCDGAAIFYIQDVSGSLVRVDEQCVSHVLVALPNGFVDACLGRDENGCLFMKMARSA